MKKILLIIALLNTIIFAKIVDKNYNAKKLQSLAYTKWYKLDSKFKTKFLKDSKKYIPILLDKAKEPLEYVGENKLSNLLIDRGDYAYIYLYLRYLEFKKDKKEILKVYSLLLEGVDSAKTQYSNSLLTSIFAVVINREIDKNIDISIDSKIFDKYSSKKLLKVLSKYAIFDNSILTNGINSEFDSISNNLRYVKKYDSDFLKRLGIDIPIEEDVGLELSNHLVEINEELRGEILDILQIKNYNEQNLEAKKFSTKIKAFRDSKETINRLKKINSSGVEFKNLPDSDREFLIDYIAKKLIYMPSSLKMYIKINKDFNELIAKNQKIIKELKAIK